MAESYDTSGLEYLRDPRVAYFSSNFFGSNLRLPIAAVFLELTPIVNEDTAYYSQVASILDIDRGNGHREFQKLEKQRMILRTDEVSENRSIHFTRTASGRWGIIECAVKVVKEDILNITQETVSRPVDWEELFE